VMAVILGPYLCLGGLDLGIPYAVDSWRFVGSGVFPSFGRLLFAHSPIQTSNSIFFNGVTACLAKSLQEYVGVIMLEASSGGGRLRAIAMCQGMCEYQHVFSLETIVV
jgi:hypothetical protein